MKVILLSGGSGRRLWPLSNDSRSKQFLKVLSDEHGEKQSMAQRVWSQLERAKLSSSTVIATSKTQVEMLQKQLTSKIPLVVEPERRDTFPAIALAATYLYSVQGVKLDEVVTVLPVDPYVEDEFFTTIKQLENVITTTPADLALIGAKPTHPSEKYGYMIPSDEPISGFIKVKKFIEKPKEKLAETIIENNGLWNCGVFAFKLNFVISYLQKAGFPIQYDELVKQYDILPKNSFDYEVVERTSNIIAIPYHGYWKDLGTWNTLTEEMLTKQIGLGKICDVSLNTHIVNELEIPIVVLGIPDAVIAASPDGILVSNKDASPGIKKQLDDFKENSRFEERLWGFWKELDRSYTANDAEVVTRKTVIKSGAHLKYQFNPNIDIVLTLTNGQGQFVKNEKVHYVQSGAVLQISANTPYALKALTDLEMIEVRRGKVSSGEGSICLMESWSEIEELYAPINNV